MKSFGKTGNRRFEELRTEEMADGSVQTAVTSNPYSGVRRKNECINLRLYRLKPALSRSLTCLDPIQPPMKLGHGFLDSFLLPLILKLWVLERFCRKYTLAGWGDEGEILITPGKRSDKRTIPSYMTSGESLFQGHRRGGRHHLTKGTIRWAKIFRTLTPALKFWKYPLIKPFISKTTTHPRMIPASRNASKNTVENTSPHPA